MVAVAVYTGGEYADVGYRSAYVQSRVEGQNGQHVFQIPAVTLGHNLPGWIASFPEPWFLPRISRACTEQCVASGQKPLPPRWF